MDTDDEIKDEIENDTDDSGFGGDADEVDDFGEPMPVVDEEHPDEDDGDVVTDEPDGGDSKPHVVLVGKDGNAFSIMGECMRVARLAGWDRERVSAWSKEAMSQKSYDDLLVFVTTSFDVS